VLAHSTLPCPRDAPRTLARHTLSKPVTLRCITPAHGTTSILTYTWLTHALSLACELSRLISLLLLSLPLQRYTKRCRKKLVEITADNGRGAVADQIRAILADHAFAKSPADLFGVWDDDGEGSVSRKEFRYIAHAVGSNARHAGRA
jgi:hypothetical protein